MNNLNNVASIPNQVIRQQVKRQAHLAKTYDVVWIVDGRCRQVMKRNTLRPIANWEKKRLENSTHTTGKVLVVINGTYK